MNKLNITILLIALTTIIVLYVHKLKSIDTLTYFPPDDHVTFTKATTHLAIDKNGKLNWSILSESEQPVYLRQDISVVYENGRFKGVLNKWEQQTSTINERKEITPVGNKFYDSISFHHGEIQYDDQKITSIQKLSHDYLYVDTLNKEQNNSFKQPRTPIEKKLKNELDQANRYHLTLYWSELIQYFNINEQDYLFAPLTSLTSFTTKPLPSLSQKQTNRVLGQLWEGLYKNYIIPLMNKKNHDVPHFMPLILFAKDGSHLYVLFELNGEKMILKQLTE